MSVRAVLGANMLTTDRPEQTRHRDAVRDGRSGATACARTSRDSWSRPWRAARVVHRRSPRDYAGPLARADRDARARGSRAPRRTRARVVRGVRRGHDRGRARRASRRAHTREDFAGRFRAAVEPRRRRVPAFAPDERVSNAALIMFGGIETTESLILNALWLLLTHRDQLALLRERPELLDNAIEESLRYESPSRASSASRPATRPRRRRRWRPGRGHRTGGPREPRPGLLPRPRPLRHHALERASAPRLRRRPARLPRHAPRPPRARVAVGRLSRRSPASSSTSSAPPHPADSSSASRQPSSSCG